MPVFYQLYVDTNSWLHRMDPRTKFIIFFTFGSIPGFWNVATHTIPIFLVALSVALSLKVPTRKMLPFFGMIAFITPVSFIFNLLFFSLWTYQLPMWATPPQFYNIFVTNEGVPPYGQWSALWVAIGYFFGHLSTAISALIMVWSTRQSEYTAALEGFKFPYWFGFGVATSFRLLPGVLGTYLQILDAQRARGSALGGGKMFIFSPKAFRSLRYMVTAAIPLFFSTFKMTAEASLALDARGVDLTAEALKRKTQFVEHRLSGRDKAIIALCLFIMVFAWVTGRYYYWGFKLW
ncbi:MAG: energy-coupling factor transporter transmembrane protein EcfT [Candidatus Bathyarchaeota archaeon]|nr:MAG: energy-coupling factor transporter transmembrane protein EcfT [Candidatus Bathyarchaeota archaeon]